ncbi:MAG: MFS transporter, partial [Pseudomonadota bacterium]
IVSTFVNARLVRTLGMRRLSHFAVLCLIVLSGIGSLFVALAGGAPLSVLVPFMAVAFFFIGLILPNFNALCMEDLGQVAGTGSAFVGFMMTGAGALLGGLVGQFFDGSIRPLVFGFLIYSVVCLIIVLATERGRLMHASPSHATG